MKKENEIWPQNTNIVIKRWKLPNFKPIMQILSL